MGIISSIELPSPQQILSELPLSPSQAAVVEAGRREIMDILAGRSERKILIAGPCSAWPSEAVVEFAEKLAQIAEQVKEKILIVMRTYTQKPRTIGGWPGPLIYPDPYGPPDTAEGIRYCRKMILDVLKAGLPAADEMLFPENGDYLTDLLSYVAVGARSVGNPLHRYAASALDIPVGMKNPPSGDIVTVVNSIMVAQSGHTFPMGVHQIISSGNPWAHLILRGGKDGPNYYTKVIEDAAIRMWKVGVLHGGVLVDGSHDNCVNGSGEKDYMRQPDVIMSTIDSMRQSRIAATHMKGWMVEASLVGGKQDPGRVRKGELVHGQSITDACISIEVLKQVIWEIYAKL